MAVKSGFFNSINNDRQYNAEDFGSFFDGIMSEGVFSNVGERFNPAPGTGMSVSIGSGKGWFLKTWIYNDAPITIELNGADTLLNRIDAIVIDVDVSSNSRRDDIIYVPGVAATHPDKPVLENTTTHKQFAICYVSIGAGSTSIAAGNIENAIESGETPLARAILDLDENFNVTVERGGTGRNSVTEGRVLVGKGTQPMEERAIDGSSGGVNGSTALTTAGALYSTKTALQTAFQGGVDTIYNAVVAKGATPSSSTPTDIATAISRIDTGGITPTGTMNITNNGAYDVTNYASANVNVPTGGQVSGTYYFPSYSTGSREDVSTYQYADATAVYAKGKADGAGSGNLNISGNGSYNVKQYETVYVNVPSSGITPSGTYTFSTSYTSGDVNVSSYQYANAASLRTAAYNSGYSAGNTAGQSSGYSSGYTAGQNAQKGISWTQHVRLRHGNRIDCRNVKKVTIRSDCYHLENYDSYVSFLTNFDGTEINRYDVSRYLGTDVNVPSGAKVILITCAKWGSGDTDSAAFSSTPRIDLDLLFYCQLFN